MTATILIVDDEKNIRRTVRMVLEGEGYAVEEAARKPWRACLTSLRTSSCSTCNSQASPAWTCWSR
jgi:CheY-like chemotaxis protein